VKLWRYAAASTAVIIGTAAAPAQAATSAPSLPSVPSAPPNGGPVSVVGGTSPTRGRIGVGSGRVGTIFTLTPVKGGCPHSGDFPVVRWSAPYSGVLVASGGNGPSSTGFMATGAIEPGKPAAKPGTYRAQLECWALSADHVHTSVDKVFAPASVTLTGHQLLPSLSRRSVPAGGRLGITLPGPCSQAWASPMNIVYLAAPDGRAVTGLKAGATTIPGTVAPGRYFVTAQCFSRAMTIAGNAGYAYGFAPVTVTH
jgi:hypothetical protein